MCDAVGFTARGADIVIEDTFRFGRHTAVSLEARAILADFDRGTNRLQIWTSSQCPHMIQAVFARTLGVPEHNVRIVAPDVGGSFGLKIHTFGDEVAAVGVARVEAALAHGHRGQGRLQRAPDRAGLVQRLGHLRHVGRFGGADDDVGRRGHGPLQSGRTGPEKSPVRIPAGLVVGSSVALLASARHPSPARRRRSEGGVRSWRTWRA